MSDDIERPTGTASQYRFVLEGSGLGESTYRVSGAGDLTRLRVRYEATEWQRKNSSYTDADWERDVVGAINLLVDANGGRRVPQDVVDAFNVWRLETYNSHRRQIDAQPERYGKVDWDNDPVFRRPAEVRGARYRVRWEKPGLDCWKHGAVGFVTLAEPASGAGGMVIAAADVIEKQGFDIGRQLYVDATDISEFCFRMTYLQLALRGIPATVRHGNSLSLETFDQAATPAFLPFLLANGPAFAAWREEARTATVQPEPPRPPIQPSRRPAGDPAQLSLFDPG